MVSEGDNLALHVLRAIEIDPGQVQRHLARQADVETGSSDEATSLRFSTAAAGALELAVTEAMSLGHNYIGCEHLLLGLVGEPAGTAGQVLRALGAEARLTRRAVTAALAGYVHLRAQTSATPVADPMRAADPTPAADSMRALAAALQQHLQPLIERIERLEQHLNADGGHR
jgi:ATP-dependent Clp protease ATP-binding subunit ClpC